VADDGEISEYIMWPWSLYSCFIGLIFLLMVSTLHFSGWNIFFHFYSHIAGLFRSSCSLSWWPSIEQTYQQNMQQGKSQNRLPQKELKYCINSKGKCI
jgi:hypothetical protein